MTTVSTRKTICAAMKALTKRQRLSQENLNFEICSYNLREELFHATDKLSRRIICLNMKKLTAEQKIFNEPFVAERHNLSIQLKLTPEPIPEPEPSPVLEPSPEPSPEPKKYIGVYFNKISKNFRVQIKIDGKLKHIGYFLVAKEAAIARDDYIISNGLKNKLNF